MTLPGTGSTENLRLKRLSLLALLLLVPVPSLGAAMALHLSPGLFGQIVFTVSKAWLLLFPLVWMARFHRLEISLPKFAGRGMLAAVVSGVIICIGIAGVYYFIDSFAWVDSEVLLAKIANLGLNTPGAYLLGAVYWCTINSLLEEYVWRWFVFTRCEHLMSRSWAVLASALFFTLHHVVALSAYFNTPLTMLASVGVFMGGAIWSWLYLRYRNIYASYLSHVFADIIIFLIGYKLIFLD